MHDVIIVGYGPVGVTAANYLGAAGLDVVVIERDPTPTRGRGRSRPMRRCCAAGSTPASPSG